MGWIVTVVPEPALFHETSGWVGLECFSIVCSSDRNGSLRKDVWDAFIRLEQNIKKNLPGLLNDLKLQKQFEERWNERPENSPSWCFFNPYLGAVMLTRAGEKP